MAVYAINTANYMDEYYMDINTDTNMHTNNRYENDKNALYMVYLKNP